MARLRRGAFGGLLMSLAVARGLMWFVWFVWFVLSAMLGVLLCVLFVLAMTGLIGDVAEMWFSNAQI